MSLSSLLSTRQVLTLACHAYLITVCVYGETPSTQSIMTRAPSESITAELTSTEKSTWPGESIKFIKWCCSSTTSSACLAGALYPKMSPIELAFIVICRCCSSSRESRYLTEPAVLAEIMLLEQMRQSERVVFPWSTWAKMHMFLILPGIYCNSSTFCCHVNPFFASTILINTTLI